jgi:hypothetical protein
MSHHAPGKECPRDYGTSPDDHPERAVTEEVSRANDLMKRKAEALNTVGDGATKACKAGISLEEAQEALRTAYLEAQVDLVHRL